MATNVDYYSPKIIWLLLPPKSSCLQQRPKRSPHYGTVLVALPQETKPASW